MLRFSTVSRLVVVMGVALTLTLTLLFKWTDTAVRQRRLAGGDGNRRLLHGFSWTPVDTTNFGEAVIIKEVNWTERWEYYKHVMHGVLSKSDQLVKVDKLNYTRLNCTSCVNPHQFHYIRNEERTCEKEVYILIYIHTAPRNFKRRMAVRETWGSRKWLKKFSMKVLFFLGKPSFNTTLQNAIDYESEHYHDIIQEDYTDAYRNLTYKGMSALKWITRYCPKARWILKTDDDIFVNIFVLHSHLTNLILHGFAPKRTIMCLVWSRMPVLRQGKWSVANETYAPAYFPKYCSGSAYLLTPDIVPEMYNKSLHTPFFWVDDVYITGFLPANMSVNYNSINSLYALKSVDLNTKLLNDTDVAIFGHIRKLNDMYRYWNKILPKWDESS